MGPPGIRLCSPPWPWERSCSSESYCFSELCGSPRISRCAFLRQKNLLPREDPLSEPKRSLIPEARHRDRMEELRRISEEAEAGGGLERREREHKTGKLMARERIHLLLDEGTFEALDKVVRHRCVDFGMQEQRPAADGFVTGFGRIHRRLVHVFAHDFTGFRVCLSGTHALESCNIMHA